MKALLIILVFTGEVASAHNLFCANDKLTLTADIKVLKTELVEPSPLPNGKGKARVVQLGAYNPILEIAETKELLNDYVATIDNDSMFLFDFNSSSLKLSLVKNGKTWKAYYATSREAQTEIPCVQTN